MQSVVFVPGLLSDGALFAAQIKALTAKGYDARAIPALGGDSIAEIAATILAQAPPTFILGGISMGGYTCLEIMRQAPERVTRLMLFNTSARAETEAQQEKRSALIELAQIGRFKGVTPRLLPLLINAKHVHDEKITTEIFAMAERIGRDNFVIQQRAIMTRVDSLPLLRRITVPALVVGGEDDQITPPDLAREIAANIKDSELHVLADCGHLSTIEQPERVNELIVGFLKRNA